MKGILGRKIGMTQVFTKSGVLVPVTVVEIEPNVVTQIKTKETDGYEAIQLGFSTKREKLMNKPAMGHLKKANTTPKRFLREIRGVDVNSYQLGQEVKVDLFEEGQIVDVSGISKGKGMQGVIKRHNQSRGPMSHGSHFHRRPGSMGTMLTMRVMPGKKLPGHMGFETVTIQNLEVVTVDLENNLLLIKGNVPGPKKCLVIIKTAVKKPNVKNKVQELISYEEAEELAAYDEAEEIVESIEEVTEEETEEAIEEIAETEEKVGEAVEETDAEEVEEKEEASQEEVKEEN